jgi:hypothetical protein
MWQTADSQPALRRAVLAVLAVLAATHAPLPVVIPLFDWCFQPQLDQLQNMPVGVSAGHRF